MNRHLVNRRRLTVTLALLLFVSAYAEPDLENAKRAGLIAGIGAQLFFDANLSRNRTQSCSTCHDPAYAFSDSRDNGVGAAVSLGDDGESLGRRNAPSLTYAALVPDFHRDEFGEPVGGLFIDGRAENMVEQAAEPFLNPIEMALPDIETVVRRVGENENYVTQLTEQFGQALFEDDARVFLAVRESIAAYLRSPQLSSFDSKYDRFLRGEDHLSPLEEQGRVLFFSNLVNCSQCHLHDNGGNPGRETFTNNRYHNIGVPANPVLRDAKAVDEGFVDEGLFANPVVDDVTTRGKFRVPGLRNVAVTGPYMHNGVFSELETAILFYSKFTVVNADSVVNPETGRPWAEAEIKETVDHDLLQDGQPIDASRALALAAFLRTLTDRRYESLLDQ